MKVFISWSGTQSKRLAEAFRDWLPGVLQMVAPYFTPSDVEKGSRWANDIAKELESSQIGVLCITRDNLHSDWILFEAGALSKSLEKAHVCPILFGISNTDLTGPLKQFQTTTFDKIEIHKLLGVINSRLGEHKLTQKTLDNVFEKWWPDLEATITGIMSAVKETEEPIRSDRDLIEEILLLSRSTAKRSLRPSISPVAIRDLLEKFIALHEQQQNEMVGYQETLDEMKQMNPSIKHIASRYAGVSDELDELIAQFNKLTYTVHDAQEEPEPEEDDRPF